MTSKARKTVAWAGALLTSALIVGTVATAPFGVADTADQQGTTDAAAIIADADIKSSGEWKDTYPNEFETFMMNDQNVEDVDYNKEFPFLATLYAGNAFSTDYMGARGHTYALEDVAATERPHKLANCLSCKTPQMNALIASGDTGVYTLPFEDVLELCEEPVGCYTCHENTGSDLVVTNVFLNDALGADVDEVPAADKVCGQCHDEYYFDPETKATTLPYTSLDTMTPEAILAYYNDIGFSDYTDPKTGIEFVKVQHPDFETVLGEGNKMAAMGYTCASCHMGTSTDADGNEFANHNLVSPLDNEQLIADDCSKCHKDLKGEVEAIQKAVGDRVNTIGQRLADLTDKIAEAKDAGTISDDDFAKIADLDRTAVYYWDFVFVENGDGAHNSALANDCLDKAEAAADEIDALLA